MSNQFIWKTHSDGRRRRYWKYTCLVCGKVFHSCEKKANFCNKTCQSESLRKPLVALECSMCKEEFFRKANDIHKTKHGKHFCSILCANTAKQLENGILHLSHYGKGTQSYRRVAIRKYGARCDNCGFDLYRELLEVHHIDNVRSNNSLSNLIVLCVQCHAGITRGVATLEERRLVWKAPQDRNKPMCKS